jgi:hypothetical protein
MQDAQAGKYFSTNKGKYFCTSKASDFHDMQDAQAGENY